MADEKTDRLLGAHILAPEAGEMIQTAVLAIRFGLTVTQMRETMFPYLTNAEGLKLAIFAVTGLVISAGLRAIVQYMPFAGLFVGVALLLLGLWLFAGKALPFSLPHLNLEIQTRNRKSVFLFGLAYGLASLSCTLPVFLAVLGAGLATASFAATGVMFLVYGLGMASVLMSVSVGAALLRGAVEQWFRKLLPYVNRLGAALLIVAGIYLIWYQGRYLPLVISALGS